MTRPPFGICLPCRYRRCRDGDTVEITVTGAYLWAIRLEDCWAPEKHTDAGKAAAAFARHVLENTTDLTVWVKLSPEIEAKVRSGQPLNLLKEVATFDRLVGHLYIDGDTTLSEMMVRAGHATVTKTKTAS